MHFGPRASTELKRREEKARAGPGGPRVQVMGNTENSSLAATETPSKVKFAGVPEYAENRSDQDDAFAMKNIDTSMSYSNYALSPQTGRQAQAYLVKPTFQYFATRHRKYTSVQKPHIQDRKLDDFISNRTFKSPHETELTQDSTLMQRQGQRGLPHLSSSRRTHSLNKSVVVKQAQNEEGGLIGSLPKSFNFIKKNKIRLLMDYIGQEEAKKNGIGPNSSFVANMENLVAKRMERDIARYESAIKERAWTSQKVKLDQLIDHIEPQIPPEMSNEQQLNRVLYTDEQVDGETESKSFNVSKVNQALFIVRDASGSKN